MLASITPLGERGRGRRWGRTTTAYALASGLGGAVVGVVAGTAGAAARAVLHPATAASLIAVVCGLAALLDLRGGPLPGPRRQVDERWLVKYRGWVYGAGFGFQLGLGVVTIVTTASVYAVVALAALTGSPIGGALVGVVFGLVRAAPLLMTASVTTPAQLRALHRRADAWRPRAHRAAVAAQAAVAVGAVAWVVR